MFTPTMFSRRRAPPAWPAELAARRAEVAVRPVVLLYEIYHVS